MWREAMTPQVGTNQHIMPEGSYIGTTLRGNTKSYTLDRLKREAPALFKRVCAGEHAGRARGQTLSPSSARKTARSALMNGSRCAGGSAWSRAASRFRATGSVAASNERLSLVT